MDGTNSLGLDFLTAQVDCWHGRISDEIENKFLSDKELEYKKGLRDAYEEVLFEIARINSSRKIFFMNADDGF